MEATLQQSEVWTWTQEFSSARTAKNGVIRPSYAGFKMQSALNAMVPINLNIIGISLGVVKQTPKLILLGLKQSRVNCAWNAKAIIRQTPTNVHFRDISSIGNSTLRNTKNFMKTEDSQFIQL